MSQVESQKKTSQETMLEECEMKIQVAVCCAITTLKCFSPQSSVTKE